METIGPKAAQSANGNGSDVQTFVDFLSDPNTSIPLESNFLIAFDALPGVLGGSTGSVPNFPSDFENEWNVSDTRKVLIESVVSTQHTSLGGQVCLFAQGFSVPGESVSAERVASVLGGPSGGLLAGMVTKERTQYGQLRLGILETNKSFLDFVIRPWIALVGHYGLISRDKNSTQNVKADITGIFYDKDNDNKIRKVFKFKGCAPVTMAETDYSYGKSEMRIAPVTFSFNTFSVSNVADVGGNAGALAGVDVLSRANTRAKEAMAKLKTNASINNLYNRVLTGPISIKKPTFTIK